VSEFFFPFGKIFISMITSVIATLITLLVAQGKALLSGNHCVELELCLLP
jgi:sorbitol-specific phosphotransferase system component IIC